MWENIAKEHYDRINLKIKVREKGRIKEAAADIVKRPPRFGG